MCFKKPWRGVKSIYFDFNAKSSNTDYEPNKPNPKFPAHAGFEKSLVEFIVPKQ